MNFKRVFSKSLPVFVLASTAIYVSTLMQSTETFDTREEATIINLNSEKYL